MQADDGPEGADLPPPLIVEDEDAVGAPFCRPGHTCSEVDARFAKIGEAIKKMKVDHPDEVLCIDLDIASQGVFSFPLETKTPSLIPPLIQNKFVKS